MKEQKMKELQKKIQAIHRKRQRHEQTIQILLNGFTKDTENYEIETGRTLQTVSSDISHQVNLLTHLSAQNDQGYPSRTFESSRKKCARKMVQSPSMNQLGESLQQIFGEEAKFNISPGEQFDEGSLYSENSEDFELVAQYLQKNCLWNDVFRLDEKGYYVNLAKGYSQACQNPLSSAQKYKNYLPCHKVLPQQQYLLLCSQLGQTQHSKINTNNICLGLLLLHRAFRHLQLTQAPQFLQSLLGYPYRSFDITKTNQYFDFISNLQQLLQRSAQKVVILGESAVNHRLVELPVRKMPHKPSKLLEKFVRMVLIDTRKDLSSYMIDIVHKRNHYVVIDLQARIDAEFLLTLISKEVKKQRRKEDQTCFRMCLFCVQEGQTKMISTPPSPCKIINHGINKQRESMKVNLQANREYKLFVGAISPELEGARQKLQWEVPTQWNLSLICQSGVPIASSLQMRLKFNQCYNKTIETLIEGYLSSQSLSEIQKQMVRLFHAVESKTREQQQELFCQKNSKKQQIETHYLIVRACLTSFMNFYVDFVAFCGEQPRQPEIVIEYEGVEVLCDTHFKKSRKIIPFSQSESPWTGFSLMEKVYLSKSAQIMACAGKREGFSFSTINL